MADATLDLVWCRDVMVHVERPDDAFAEFARVLRPGGHVVAFQAVATDLLGDEEADWLFDVMGVVPASADPRVVDDAITRSGLHLVDTIDLSTEWGDGRRSRTAAGAARSCTWRGCCASPSATVPSSGTRRTT